MSLLKKIIFSLFVISAIVFGIWAYLNIKNKKKPHLDAVSVLPDNCLIYLNTNNFFELNKKLNSQSLIVDKLKDFPEIDVFCGILHRFDSLANSNELIRQELTNNMIHFALYDGNFDWLAAFNLKELGDQKATQEQLSVLFNAKADDKDFLEFEIKKNIRIYFCLNSGIVLFSNSKEQLNLSLTKSVPKLITNPSFNEFKTTLDETNLLSVYTNHSLYSKSKIASKLNLTKVIQKGYSAGSIDIQPSQLTITGYAVADSAQLISLLASQNPQPTKFIEYLPYNTVSFKAYGFNSFSEIKNKAEQLFKQDSKNYWKQINDSALYNVEQEFYQNIENYLVEFETEMPKQKFTGIKILDSMLTLEHLKLMSDSEHVINKRTVFHLKNTNVINGINLFSPLLSNKVGYAIYMNSFIYFAEDKNQLASLIANIDNRLLLSGNENFVNYKNQHFPETFNYLIYTSPKQIPNEIPYFFGFNQNSKTDAFENFKHFIFSLTNDATSFRFRCQLTNEVESTEKEQTRLWTLKLDTISTMKASQFINHITNENELLVQDESKNLYLLNAKGTLLWKKKIIQKITSPIFTVDIFKNKKYQLLFSSKNYLHLIDRNGKYVDGYPIKLPEECSSPLNVIDYDGDKNYRLFIACKNNRIYNYSIYGIKQEGFTPFKTDKEVELPIQYVKVGGSDYLVAVDKEGRIYTFSRKGEARIGLKNKTVANCSAFYVDETNKLNTTNLVYVDDKSALIHKISFSDKKEIVKLNSEIANARVHFAQIDDNKNMDLLITTDSDLRAYDLNGNPLFEKNNAFNLTKADFYSDESHSLFYTWSETQKEVFIYNQLIPQTRVFKATELPLILDLFNNNKKYFIITNGAEINCVLLD